MIGIYIIANKINKKVYIGQSINIRKRLWEHKHSLNKNVHYNVHLQKSWNKYGEDNFEFNVLCECNESNIDELEKYFIMIYNSNNSDYGYNLQDGGRTNKTIHADTIKKLKENHHGMTGKNHSDDTKKIMREKAIGRKLSSETKNKLSLSHIGKNTKKFYCIEADIIFNGSLEAAKFAGLKSRSSIIENVAGRKSYAGKHPVTGEKLHWIKIEDEYS